MDYWMLHQLLPTPKKVALQSHNVIFFFFFTHAFFYLWHHCQVYMTKTEIHN